MTNLVTRSGRTLVEFAAQRRGDQDTLEKDLYPFVAQAMKNWPAEGWYNELLAVVAREYLSTFHNEGGRGEPKPSAADFTAEVRATLDKTQDPDANTVDRVSTWLSTAILNAGTQAAADTDEEFLVMEWVTMHDEDVRPAHAVTEGQQRPIGEKFDVDGTPMRYPGDPTAPIELWINCRCTVAPLLAEDTSFPATTREGVTMTTDTATEPERVDLTEATPWHGVLAPEGVWSGDGRRFAEGALEFRDLPIPLTWQKATGDGHDGSVVIGKIDAIERVGNMMNGSGTFLTTPEADEVVGLISEFGRFGVSVDADSAEMDFDQTEADDGKITFTSARIASASVVTIPAFSEAYITLGPWEDQAPPEDVCDPESPNYDPDACEAKKQAVAEASAVIEFVSDKPWSDFTQADYSDEQWKRACIMHVCDGMEKSCHKLPIREPGGALNRNAVHAAASRFGQAQGPAEAKASAKRALRGAYKQIGEDPPDAIKASALMDVFKRGPGWVTHPADTRRIHDYWTKKGQPGYAKIGWGVPGDFNRCRILVGEKIAKNSPEDMRFLNQICAQWHHDALGIWPGRPVSGETLPFKDETPVADALTLVASATSLVKAAWFADPNLSGPTPFTVTADGRVFGHLAQWGTCHTGFDGVCVMPPPSPSSYAYFLTGAVLTDEGTQIPVGQISMGGGHARPGMRWRPALSHYDSTSAAVADITCGEDDHGIWVAGQTRDLTDAQMRELRASPLSGDWRTINSDDLELIAALAVNVQGFPVPRVGIAAGTQISLVAAAPVMPKEEDHVDRYGLDPDMVAEAILSAMDRRESRRVRLTTLRQRVTGGQDRGL